MFEVVIYFAKRSLYSFCPDLHFNVWRGILWIILSQFHQHPSFSTFKERFLTCSQMKKWRTSLAAWGQRFLPQDWLIQKKTAGSSSSTGFGDSSRWNYCRREQCLYFLFSFAWHLTANRAEECCSQWMSLGKTFAIKLFQKTASQFYF